MIFFILNRTMDGTLIEDAILRGNTSFNQLAKKVLLTDKIIIQNLYKFSFIGIINVIKFQYLEINTINTIISFVKKNRKIKRTAFLTLLEEIIIHQRIDDNFLNKFSKYLNWNIVCRHQVLSKEIIFVYFNKFQIRDLIIFQNLPKEIIEDNIHIMDMELISEYQSLDEDFIEKFIAHINLNKLGENNQFRSSFILRYKTKLNIELLCRTQTIEDYVLRDLISSNLNVCFDTISWRQNLSEDFMREYFMFLNKDDIVSFQKLSESFIEEFWDHLSIELVSSYQKLSYCFFRLHKNDLYMTDCLERTIKNGHRVLAVKLMDIFNPDILQLIETYL